MPIKLVSADIVSAFDPKAIGTKVTDQEAFLDLAVLAIEAFDFAGQRVPGQGFIMCPKVAPYVSAGVGPRTANPDHYVCREHRGRVDAYLKREHAAKVEGCALIVYTKSAYLHDPEVTVKEACRIEDLGATHVLVAVLAFAGPKAPLGPYRLVSNLGGGNNEALDWTADEIRTKAKESMAYDAEWVVVAD